MNQTVFNFQFQPQFSFESFVTDDGDLLAQSLKEVASGQNKERQIVVYGQMHTGKTHVLQAVIQKTLAAERQAMYVPLAEFNRLDTEVLQGLEGQHVVAIDDIDAVAGQLSWERSLVELFDRWRRQEVQIVASMKTCPDANAPFHLPDLNSRLCWGATHKLVILHDEQLEQALQIHAKLLGMYLPAQVSHYMLTHRTRDIAQLVEDLRQINTASLSQKKKISVDLVRKLFALE